MKKQKSLQNPQSFLQSAFILGTSLIVVKIIGACFKIPLMNLLGETGMAYFSAAYTVFSMIYAITASGLSTAGAKLFSSDPVCSDRDTEHFRRVMLVLYGGIGLCGTAVMFFGAKTFAGMMHCEPSAFSIAAGSAAVILCCLMAAYRGYFEGNGNMIPTAVSQVAEAFSKLIFGLWGAYWILRRAKLAFLQKEPVFGIQVSGLEEAISSAMPYASGAVMLGVSASTLTGLISLMLFRRQRQENRAAGKRTQNTGQMMKKLFQTAFPIIITTIIMQTVPLIDTITVPERTEAYFRLHAASKQMTEQMIAPGESPAIFCYGVYCACVTIFNLIPAGVSLISKSIIPAVSRLSGQNRQREARDYITAVLHCSMYVCLPASLGLSAVSESVLAALYTRQPHTVLLGKEVLQLLGIAAVFCGLLYPLTAVLQAGGYFWTTVIWYGIGSACKWIGNYILIPQSGIAGAALSTLIAYAVMAAGLFCTADHLYGGIKGNIHMVRIAVSSGISAAGAWQIQSAAAGFFQNRRLILSLSMFSAVILYWIQGILWNSVSKKAIKLLSNGEKLRKGLEKIRIIR